MRILRTVLFICALALLHLASLTAGPPATKDAGERAREVVGRMLLENAAFVKEHPPAYFEPFASSQEPMVTVLSCSDSRVHMHCLDSDPDNHLFVVRDIGNQLATSEGSVEYGVRHLHTPLLLVLGHVRCGAIKAASGDYSKESPAIKRELDSLHVSKGGDWLGGIRANVHDQVRAALKEFAPEVAAGSLTVLGAVYDFAGDLGQGHGRLSLIDVDGETDPVKVGDFVASCAPQNPKG